MQEVVFRKNVELKKEMELLYRGTRFRLGYTLDDSGKSAITFGEENLPSKLFYSYGELMNNAMLGISPLSYSIDSLELLNP